MALTKTYPTQDASGLSVTDTRRVTAGLIVRNADGTPRPGIFPAHTNALVTGRASMGYDVAPFLAATSRLNTGVELVANDAVTIVATTAAPGANSRIDVIWVQSRFVQHADASNLPVFGVTQGSAAAVPTKPAIPAGALELATAEVLSTTTTTATAVITQTHQYTAAAGGVVLVRSKAELDAWNASNGSRAMALDTDLVWIRRAGTWFVTPGQPLAYMAASSGTAVVNSMIGSVASTPDLPVGQRVKVRCSRVSGFATSAGPLNYALKLRNNAADVTVSAFDKERISRAYQAGGGLVVSIPGVETEFVTTSAAKVTAALYLGTGVWTAYGLDGQELWIESA